MTPLSPTRRFVVFVSTGCVIALAIGFMVWKFGVSISPAPTADAGPQVSSETPSSIAAPSPTVPGPAVAPPAPSTTEIHDAVPARGEQAPVFLPNDPLLPPNASIGALDQSTSAGPLTGTTDTATAATQPVEPGLHSSDEGSREPSTQPDSFPSPADSPAGPAEKHDSLPSTLVSPTETTHAEANASEPAVASTPAESKAPSPTGIITEPTIPLVEDAVLTEEKTPKE